MVFNNEQIKDLLRIISFHHTSFIGSSIGKEVLTSDDRELLLRFGVDPDLAYTDVPITDQAYHFGRLAKALGNIETKDISYNEFKRYLSRDGFANLSTEEKSVLESIKTQNYSAIKNLEGTIKKDITDIVHDSGAKRRRYEDIIRTEMSEAVLNRKSWKDIISGIGHKTGDWNRKLGRLVETEMHNAYEEGRASIIERQNGKDAVVYKDVYPGACKYCIALYLTGGIGSEPKKFKLSVLRANGTNVNKKAADWKPVIGSTHPHCRCTLETIPSGYKWNEKSRSYSTPDPQFKRKTDAHKKAPITIYINGKTYVV